MAVEVLCDVDNPLCGEHGAARVYGPQKGATPEMVEQLDAGLAHWRGWSRSSLGRDIACLPGAGAAGGLAAGAVAFMNARLVPGIDAIMSQIAPGGGRRRRRLGDHGRRHLSTSSHCAARWCPASRGSPAPPARRSPSARGRFAWSLGGIAKPGLRRRWLAWNPEWS